MLRLSAGSRRLSGSEFQVEGLSSYSKTPTTETVHSAIMWNDQFPLTGGPQMLTTSNVDGWCALCSCSPAKAELFHEETDTSARQAWIILGLWLRVSGARHAVATTSRCRTSECGWRDGDRIHHLLQHVFYCEPQQSGQYNTTIVCTRQEWTSL